MSALENLADTPGGRREGQGMTPTASIIIANRYRQDLGDIVALAESIRCIGLLHLPIVDKGNRLIDGERRIRAMEHLGWTDIPVRVVDVPSLLQAENDANELAKQWTVSERVAIGRAIESELAGRAGNPSLNCGNISTIGAGQKTRDIVAEKAGLGSGKTYEAAKKAVDEAAPEIIRAMDSGAISINLASQVAELPEEEQRIVAAAAPEEIKGVAREAVHNHRAQGTGINEWFTPEQYVRAAREVLGEIDIDPASSELAQKTVKAGKFFTIDDDGLKQEWNGTVFLNPPYAQPAIHHFMQKMVDEYESGRMTEGIALTHNYTDTRWFHIAAKVASAICFTQGRIGFLSPEGKKAAPTQGQAFFYVGDRRDDFADSFRKFGFVLVRP